MPTVAPLEPTDPARIGPHTLLGRLGAGGMGQVYLARSRGGRLLAVKVMHDALVREPSFRTRFRQEVAAARQVNGIFTAPVVDADPDAARPWLATLYVDGPSLAGQVAQAGPLPAESVLALAAGLAESLLAIHATGVLHRDLKPSNVLLAADGPRVIDFGIARLQDDSRQTATGLLIGTPAFMSPEVVRGEAPSEASDVFSLGAVLCFAATGRGPFGTGATHALLYRVVHEEPGLDGLGPAHLRELVAGCLAKAPGDRPSPAAIMAAASAAGAGPQRGAADAPDRPAAPNPPTRVLQPPVLASPVPAPPAAEPTVLEPPAAEPAVPEPPAVTELWRVPVPEPAVPVRPGRRPARGSWARPAGAGLLAVLVLVAAAATANRDGPDRRVGLERAGATAARDITVRLGIEAEPTAYNTNVAAGAADENLALVNLTQRGFGSFAPDGTFRPDTDFGTVQLVSQRPLTVRYTIDAEAGWSDGTPVTCADAVLTWLANSGAGAAAGFRPVDPGGYALQQRPRCDSQRQFTVTYRSPFADWRSLYGRGAILPAHVLQRQAGLRRPLPELAADPTDPELSRAAAFYNSGWKLGLGPAAAGLTPSSGPYLIDRWIPGRSLTLRVNPRWWGRPPLARTVVFSFDDDAAQVTALQQGRVDVMETFDPRRGTVDRLRAQGAATVTTTYGTSAGEALVMNFRSAFADPRLRAAVASCVPRQQIVDDLIRPVQPTAEVPQARLVLPLDSRYAAAIAGTGGGRYVQPDPARARALLADAGRPKALLRIGWRKNAVLPDPRDAGVVERIRDACGAVGFTVVDVGTPTFGTAPMPDQGWDVALLPSSGRPTLGAAASRFTSGPAERNPGHYADARTDLLLRQLLATPDPERQLALLRHSEAHLWAELPTLPLFVVPGLTASSPALTGVTSNGTEQGATWNADRWDLR